MSPPPFASLNLARTVGDDPNAVKENHRRFAEAVGFPVDQLYEVSQVHGAQVLEAAGDPIAFRTQDGDALVARIPGTAVAVRTADCVPVLVADARRGHVAAIHAGWRGAAAGIVERGVEALLDGGGAPDDLIAAIGPHIRVGSFEVGEEVVEALARAAPDTEFVDRTHPKPHVDLSVVVRFQLLRSGVRTIDDVGGCTFTESERFYSYRRDGRNSGRHLSVIVAQDKAAFESTSGP